VPEQKKPRERTKEGVKTVSCNDEFETTN